MYSPQSAFHRKFNVVAIAFMSWRLHLNPIRFMVNPKRYAEKKTLAKRNSREGAELLQWYGFGAVA